MRVALHRRRPAAGLPGVVGVARVDRSTAALTGRLRTGEIAVLDHLDLDRAAAERLVAAAPAAVLNVSPCASGRHAALGAGVLVRAGIPLVDAVGPEIFRHVREGQRIRVDVDTGRVYPVDPRTGGDGPARGSVLLATGVTQTETTTGTAESDARAGLATRLAGLVGDATDTLCREADLLLDGPAAALPLLDAASGRPVLVVTDRPRAARELALVRRWVRRSRPLVVGVDGGAAVAAAAGLRVDVVVGALTDLPDEALLDAGLVVPGDSAGAARAAALGRAALPLRSGLPAVAAVLAALAAGAPRVVVAAGLPAGVDELLDLGRGEAAAVLLARLRLGDRLVDATAAAGVQRRRRERRDRARRRPRPGVVGPLLVLLAGLLAAVVVLVVSEPGRALLRQLLPGFTLP